MIAGSKIITPFTNPLMADLLKNSNSKYRTAIMLVCGAAFVLLCLLVLVRKITYFKIESNKLIAVESALNLFKFSLNTKIIFVFCLLSVIGELFLDDESFLLTRIPCLFIIQFLPLITNVAFRFVIILFLSYR